MIIAIYLMHCCYYYASTQHSIKSNYITFDFDHLFFATWKEGISIKLSISHDTHTHWLSMLVLSIGARRRCRHCRDDCVSSWDWCLVFIDRVRVGAAVPAQSVVRCPDIKLTGHLCRLSMKAMSTQLYRWVWGDGGTPVLVLTLGSQFSHTRRLSLSIYIIMRLRILLPVKENVFFNITDVRFGDCKYFRWIHTVRFMLRWVVAWHGIYCLVSRWSKYADKNKENRSAGAI